MLNKLRLSLAVLILAAAPVAIAQEDTTQKKMTRSMAEALVSRPAMQPVKSLDPVPESAVLDTIDTSNPLMKIVLYSDGTWKFQKDGNEVMKSDAFTKNWVHQGADPYKMDWTKFPDKSIVWLVDSTGHYHYPGMKDIQISSKFGYRHGRWHRGVDIRMPRGENIYATFDGKVRMAKYMSGYGNLVVVRHENGLETFYGHMTKILVKEDDWVTAGQVIGTAGATGRASGSHLHYEVRYLGCAIDPEWLLDFSNGDLRHSVLVLKKKYLNPNCRYEPESDDDEEAIAEADEKDRLEAERLAAEAKAAQYHTIRSGDTLGGIAIKYGTTVSKICKLNNISSRTTLRIGRKIRVK